MFENVYLSQFFLGKYVITFDYPTDKKGGVMVKKFQIILLKTSNLSSINIKWFWMK